MAKAEEDTNITHIKNTIDILQVAEQVFINIKSKDIAEVSDDSYSILLLSMQMIQENLQGLSQNFTEQHKELADLYSDDGLWFKNDRLFVTHNLDINKLYSSKKDLLEYFRSEYFGILKPMLHKILDLKDAQPHQETSNIVVEQPPVMVQKQGLILGDSKLKNDHLLKPYIINIYACLDSLILKNQAPETIAVILQTIGNNIKEIRQKCSQQSLEFLNSLEGDNFLWFDLIQIRNHIAHSTDFSFLNNIEEYNEIACDLIPKMKIITNHFFDPIKQVRVEVQNESNFTQVELKKESTVAVVLKAKNKKHTKVQVEEKSTKSSRRQDKETQFLKQAILFCLAAMEGNEDEMRRLIKEELFDINKPLLFTFVSVVSKSDVEKYCHYITSAGGNSADYITNFDLNVKPPKKMIMYPLCYLLDGLGDKHPEFLKPFLKIMFEEEMANFNIENINRAGNMEPIIYRVVEALEFRPVILEAFLNAGFDPNYAYRGGESLIWQSCLCPRPEALKILIEYGADILAPCRNYGYIESSAKNNTNLPRQINVVQLMGFLPNLDVIQVFFGAALEKKLVRELTILLVKYEENLPSSKPSIVNNAPLDFVTYTNICLDLKKVLTDDKLVWHKALILGDYEDIQCAVMSGDLKLFQLFGKANNMNFKILDLMKLILPKEKYVEIKDFINTLLKPSQALASPCLQAKTEQKID